MKRAVRLLLVSATGLAIVGVNAVAYMQARAMTHFSSSGTRTARPEDLGWLDAAHVVLAGVNVPRPQNTSTPAKFALPFETHRVPTSRGQTLDAWYVPG